MGFYVKTEKFRVFGSPFLHKKGTAIKDLKAVNVWFSPVGRIEFQPMTWWKTYDGLRGFILVGTYVDKEKRALRCELREIGLINGIYINYWVFKKSIKDGLYLPW
jgi:hypothetical protein